MIWNVLELVLRILTCFCTHLLGSSMRVCSPNAALSAKLRCEPWGRDLAATTVIRINWVLKQRNPTSRSFIYTMRCKVWRLEPTRTAAVTKRSWGTLMLKQLKPMVGSATTAVPIAQQTLFQGHIQKSATETLNPKPFSVASLLGTVRVAVGQRAFKNKARNPEPINLAAAGLVVYQVVRVTNPSPYLACVSTRSLSAARVHFTLLILGQRNPS